MAVGANTYGTVARVEALAGDVVPSRTFSTSTTPTLAQVEAFLDDIAAEINVELKLNGFTVPVAVSNDAEAHAFLLAANSYGAAALVLGTMPLEAYTDLEGEGSAVGRMQTYNQKLWQAIKRIREQRISATRDSATLANFRVGSEKDSDGNTNKPIFERKTFDNPSSRSLTET